MTEDSHLVSPFTPSLRKVEPDHDPGIPDISVVGTLNRLSTMLQAPPARSSTCDDYRKVTSLSLRPRSFATGRPLLSGMIALNPVRAL